ncbi:MAG TPA: FlgD immunoglobulin-like domain containing protein [Candidatus Krumholzibacteria bacterium]|nr:FlgD immunoglobulin-like domain containing protein [Candidatus Krumholzibacteria bacterium]
MLKRRGRDARACHSRLSLVVSLAVICLLLACGMALGQDATIGLYQDEYGNSCTFNDAPGFVTAYVVVTPGTGGTRAVRFAAPIPSCFDATYIGETVPFLVAGIGNSQTGISLSARDCQTEAFNVLTITYLTSSGTAACCPYPIVADPYTGMLEAVDCSFASVPIATNVARFNADASCPCGLEVPPVPTDPTPVDFGTGRPTNQQLAWQIPGFHEGLTYDVYFGTTGIPPLVASGQTALSYDPGPLSQGTTYRWQIITRQNSVSYPGPLWTFSTTGSGPQTPANPSPANGAVNVTPVPMLTWTASDPNGQPLTFDVYFGQQYPPPLVATDVPVNSYAPGTLALNTVYRWRIVTKDSSGLIYAGTSWTFTTGDGGPLPPTNPSPSDGATGVSATPTLTWTATHSQGLPMTFDVYFGTESAPPLVASNLAVASFQPGTLADGVYHWSVVARDEQNREASSLVWSFATGSVGNAPPSVPSNPYPADQSVIATTAPVFSWSTSDPDTPVLSHAIFLGLTPDVMNSLVGIGTSSVPSYSFGTLPSGRYYWMVTVSDGITSVPGPVWTFAMEIPLAVAFKHFDATSSDGRVQVEWELTADEPLNGFVLYRREGTSPQSRIVAEGALTGTTGSYRDASVEAGMTYGYELVVRAASGDEFRSPVATVSLPELALALHQNHPNPFNPETTIEYDLPSTGQVRLVILDASGRVVRTLVNVAQTAGSRSVVWNGRDDAGNAVSSGVYFYVLDAGKERLTRKLVLLK